MSRKSKSESDGSPKKIGAIAWLRGRFFAGIVIAAPIAITFMLLSWLIAEIDKRIKPLIPDAWNPETYTRFAIPGLGVIVAILLLTLLGAIATNLIGRSLIQAGDRLLSRVPVVRNLYSALKQLFETVATSNQASFKEVILIEYPKRGTWCIGFLTAAAKNEIALRLGEGKVGVFVPTTPNPTSGFLMYVDRSEIIELDMTVEEGAKMIVSAGLVVPDYAGEGGPAIAARLEDRAREAS
ncbi:MAG: DUF502 domain-containing protein [Pseudomonadota bacterium]